MPERPTARRALPLYRRLPHGPHGIAREEVSRNQRTRIYGAMIEAVSQHGYRRTAVADVLALAGVSRKAFYEQFANKEACLLATFDIALARERRRVIDGWQSERGWSNRLHAACKSLLGATAADPRAARLMLIEALTVESTAARGIRLAACFEQLIASAYAVAPGRRLAPLAPRAIVGGVRLVIVRRLLERREHELRMLSDEILDWIEAYHAPQGGTLNELVSLRSPNGVGGIRTPVEVGGRCPFDALIANARAAAHGSSQDASSWPEAVHRTLARFVAQLLASPGTLRAAARQPLSDAQAIRGLEELAGVLSAGAPAPRHGPSVAPEAVAGAVWAILSSYAAEERTAKLPRAVDQLALTVLAPYLGARAASETLRRTRALRGRRAGGERSLAA